MKNLKKIIFLLLLAVSVFVSPAVALFAGIVLALFVGNPYGALSKKVSKYFLSSTYKCNFLGADNKQ